MMGVSFAARRLGVLAVLLALAAALTGRTAVAGDANAFNRDMSQVATELNNDPSYRRLPLDGPDDQRWFTDLAYSLYKNQITTAQFVAKGVERFPDYQDSFQTIAKKLAP